MTKVVFDTSNYTDMIKFQVGQRVKIELPEVPIESRDVTTGVIIAIRTDHAHCPSLRVIRYEILFDNNGNYLKKEHRFTKEGIGPKFWFPEERLTLEE